MIPELGGGALFPWHCRLAAAREAVSSLKR